MYVETMTLEQVKREIERCDEYLHRKIWHIGSDSSYRRACLKLGQEEKRYFNTVDFKYGGFTFHLIPYTGGKREFKRIGIQILSFVTFMREGKLWSATLMPKNKVLTVTDFYHPHFFTRYAERLGIEYESTVELIGRYHRSNISWHWDDYYKEGYEDNIFITVSEGTCFGTKYEGYRLYMTFVRNDMLFNDQMGLHKVGVAALDYIDRKAV